MEKGKKEWRTCLYRVICISNDHIVKKTSAGALSVYYQTCGHNRRNGIIHKANGIKLVATCRPTASQLPANCRPTPLAHLLMAQRANALRFHRTYKRMEEKPKQHLQHQDQENLNNTESLN